MDKENGFYFETLDFQFHDETMFDREKVSSCFFIWPTGCFERQHSVIFFYFYLFKSCVLDTEVKTQSFNEIMNVRRESKDNNNFGFFKCHVEQTIIMTIYYILFRKGFGASMEVVASYQFSAQTRWLGILIMMMQLVKIWMFSILIAFGYP